MNAELEDITFLEYMNLKQKEEAYIYNYAMVYSRVLNTAEDIFNIGKFENLTFGQVKDAQYTFSKVFSWQNLFKFVIVNRKFFEICKFRRYVEEELHELAQKEQVLSYEPDKLDENAGIDRLSKFGVMIQIDRLAGGDLLKYNEVRNMPYGIAFTKLYMDKEVDDFNLRKNKLLTQRNR